MVTHSDILTYMYPILKVWAPTWIEEELPGEPARIRARHLYHGTRQAAVEHGAGRGRGRREEAHRDLTGGSRARREGRGRRAEATDSATAPLGGTLFTAETRIGREKTRKEARGKG